MKNDACLIENDVIVARLHDFRTKRSFIMNLDIFGDSLTDVADNDLITHSTLSPSCKIEIHKHFWQSII